MDDGGSVYPRRKRLWIKYKNEDGEWVPQKTPFLDNTEGRKQARALLRKVNARVRAKLAASADLGGGPVTVAKYGLKLAQGRIEQEMPSAFGDKAIFEQHLIPAAVSDDPGHALLGDMLVDEVCPLHVKRIVTGLKKKKRRRGGLLGPRTVCNIYGVLHTMFEHAKIDGLVTANPCVLPEGVL